LCCITNASYARRTFNNVSRCSFYLQLINAFRSCLRKFVSRSERSENERIRNIDEEKSWLFHSEGRARTETHDEVIAR
jgi:hypothetical protein